MIRVMRNLLSKLSYQHVKYEVFSKKRYENVIVENQLKCERRKTMKKGAGSVVATLIGGIVGAVAGGAATSSVYFKKMDDAADRHKKIISYYQLFNQWLMVRQEGKTLAEYFERNHYKTVAIYGMKEFGERLLDELKDSDITVKYIIDKNADAIYADVDVITPDDEMPSVDVIVVTATYYFDEIEDMMCEKVDYPIVSLEDILYEV